MKRSISRIMIPAVAAMGLAFSLAMAPAAHAGVIVTAENQSGDAWVHPDPAINVAGSNAPSAFGHGLTVGPTIISETFTPTETFALGGLDIAYRTSAASGTVNLRIQEADVVPTDANTPPTNYEYTAGTNLFPTTDLSFTYTVQTPDSTTQVISLKFTGADQITLTAGTTYAIEFVSPDGNSTSFALERKGSDTYSGGRLFEDRLGNTSGTRDAAMQIFAVPEPATGAVVLLGLGGLLMLPRRRKRMSEV